MRYKEIKESQEEKWLLIQVINQRLKRQGHSELFMGPNYAKPENVSLMGLTCKGRHSKDVMELISQFADRYRITITLKAKSTPDTVDDIIEWYARHGYEVTRHYPNHTDFTRPHKG